MRWLPSSVRLRAGSAALLAATAVTCDAARARADDDDRSSPAAEAQASASAPPASPVGPRVLVRFPAMGPLPYVEQRVGERWELACKAPCDRPFAPGTELRIRGRTGAPSSSVVLGEGRSVVLDAQVGTPFVRGIGTGLFVTGVAAGVGAATFVLWPSDQLDGEGRAFGGIALGVSAIALAGAGILLWMLGSSDLGVARPPATAAVEHTSRGGLRWTGSALSF